MKAPTRQSAPGTDSSIDIHIKSSRGPAVDIRLSAQPLSTSVIELKQKVAKQAGLEATDKIRILYQKKPCSDSKSIKDVLGDDATASAEFTVMFMGVTPSNLNQTATSASEETNKSPQKSEEALLEKDEFWTDLEEYLRQKLGNVPTAQKAAKLFRETWKEKGESLR